MTCRLVLLRGQDGALFGPWFQTPVPNHTDAGVPAQRGVIVVRGPERFGLLIPAHGFAQQVIGHKSRPRQPLVELRTEPLITVGPEADEKDVFELFDKYNLRSLAVVDPSGRPIGAIAVDDVISRMRSKL